MPVYKKVNKNFFKNWTNNMAYILGFFAADGYITVNKRGGQFWCIQITDKKLLQKIKKEIQAEHKISVRLSKKNGENILYRLQIGSIEMCDDLRKLGFSERKTKNLAIPNIPKKYFHDFVRGYFDGDGNVWTGNVHKNRNSDTLNLTITTVFTSCSFEFLDKLHKRLLNTVVRGGSLYRSKGNYSRLQFSVLDSFKLYDFMYNGCSRDSLLLDRKKGVFDKYIAMRL